MRNELQNVRMIRLPRGQKHTTAATYQYQSLTTTDIFIMMETLPEPNVGLRVPRYVRRLRSHLDGRRIQSQT